MARVVGAGWLALAMGLCACGQRAAAQPDAGGSDAGADLSGPPEPRGSIAPRSSLEVAGSAGSIDLACAPSGEAVVLYQGSDGARVRRYRGGSWGDPIAPPLTPFLAGISTLSSSGVVTFISGLMDSPLSTEVERLAVTRLGPGDDWSERTVVGDTGIGWWQGPRSSGSTVGLGDQGNDIVVWSRADQFTAGWPSAMWAAHVDASGAWTSDGSIDLPGGVSASFPSVLSRAQGEIMVAWLWSDGTRSRLLLARRTASRWSAPVVLTEGTEFWSPDGPRLVGGRTGAVTVVYQRSTRASMDLVSQSSADGVTWGVPQVLASAAGSSLQVAHNGVGGAVALWSDYIALQSAERKTSLRQLAANGSWSDPVLPVSALASSILLAQHPDGRIAVLSSESTLDQLTSPVLRIYTPGTGWQDPVRVEASAFALTGLCFAGNDLVAAWRSDASSAVAAAVLP